MSEQSLAVERVYVRANRIPIGNYPLWAARLIRWTLNRKLPTGVTILLRGRSPKRSIKWGFRNSIPLSESRRAGVYILIHEVTR